MWKYNLATVLLFPIWILVLIGILLFRGIKFVNMYLIYYLTKIKRLFCKGDTISL